MHISLAANMVSDEKGFVNIFKDKVGNPKIVTMKCFAHRLELVLKHSAKNCSNCKDIAEFLKALYSFYSRSSKRKDSLLKYCERLGVKCYTPKKVLEVRWVTSHYRAAQVVYLNYDILLGHLQHMLDSPYFQLPSDNNTKVLIRRLQAIAKQKHFVSTLAFQMDIMYIFKGLSQLFQMKGKSVIGQIAKREEILNQLEDIGQGRGTYMTELMNLAVCRFDVGLFKCGNLNDYETHIVTRKGIVLTEAVKHKWWWNSPISGEDDVDYFYDEDNDFPASGLVAEEIVISEIPPTQPTTTSRTNRPRSTRKPRTSAMPGTSRRPTIPGSRSSTPISLPTLPPKKARTSKPLKRQKRDRQTERQ